MTKFFSLVGLMFKQQFRTKPTQSDGDKKKSKVGTIILAILILLLVVPIAVLMFVGCLGIGGYASANLSADTYAGIVGTLILGVQGMTLLFGFHSVLSNVFNCKDADKLLYLPISGSAVFWAKFFVAYVEEAVGGALLLLITVLPFGIGLGAGVGYYLMLLPAMLLVPLLPMLVSSLLSMPLSLLLAKLGKNGIAKTIFNVVMYLAFMGLYIWLMQLFGVGGSGDKDVSDEETLQRVVAMIVDHISTAIVYIHPDYLTAKAFVATDVSGLGSFALSLAEFGALFALLALICKAFYGKMLALTVEGGGSSSKKIAKPLTVDKKGGVVRQLITSDLKRVVRDPQMGFQAFAGMLVVPLIVVILAVGFSSGNDEGMSLSELAKENGMIVGVFLMVYLTLLTAGTNVLGLFPMSRENKSLYLLKTLPVPFEKILLAKVLLATGVALVTDLITALVVVFVAGFNPLSALLMTVGLLAFGFGNMCLTTRLDLRSPKIGWSNFQTSLKNSKNSWIAMLLGLLSGVIVGVTSVGFFVWQSVSGAKYIEWLMFVAVDLVGALYAYFGYRIMRNSAEKLFEKIEP